MSEKPPVPAGTAVWYDGGIRFSCQSTGRCCTNHGEYAYVYLTAKDEERLIELLATTKTRFRRLYTLKVDGHLVLKSQRPGPLAPLAARPNPTEPLIAPVVEHGDACVFLAGKRCGVYEARPVQCSTWPFWRENLDQTVWNREVAPFCAGVGRGHRYSRAEIDEIAARLEPDE